MIGRQKHRANGIKADDNIRIGFQWRVHVLANGEQGAKIGAKRVFHPAADAGLQYLNARYDDPALGIFVQPDW